MNGNEISDFVNDFDAEVWQTKYVCMFATKQINIFPSRLWQFWKREVTC